MSYKPDLPWLKAALPSRKPARPSAPATGCECSRNGLTKPNLGLPKSFALRSEAEELEPGEHGLPALVQ
jgi:hypothetical protein